MKKESNWTCIYKQDNRRPAKEYTRERALESPLLANAVYVGVDGKNFTAWFREYRLSVLGPNIFWQQVVCCSCTYKDGKIYGTIIPLRKYICEAFKLDWITSNSWVQRILVNRKDLWKLIFSGKVTNPEALLKAASRKYFKGAYSYRNLKAWCQQGSPCSLWQVYYYTSNPDLALEKIVSGQLDTGVFWDILHYAELLNEKINPSWSGARLRNEHARQIEVVNKRKVESLSAEPIAPAFKSDGLSLILNERECYLEGCNMHNCVHSCYWSEIQRGNYLIARGTVDDLYVDLGIRVANDLSSLAFNQVHTIYNGNVPLDQTLRCKRWIEDNKEELLATARYIRTHKAPVSRIQLEHQREIVEIPF